MTMHNKSADVADTAKAVGAGVGLPLLASTVLGNTMGGDMVMVPNPHQQGGPPVQMYRPTLEATNRVRAGKGSMMDHMRAYRHPGQVQNHPLYAPINKYGPGLMGGMQNASKFFWSNGPTHGAGYGALTGLGLGLAGNAIARWMGKSEMPYWQAGLIGAGAGGLLGAGGSAYRDAYTDYFNKGAAQAPPIDVEAEEVPENQEDDQAGGLPLALMAGLGGVGATGLAHALTSDEKANRALSAFKEYDPRAFLDPSRLPEGHTDLTYYQKMLSPAAELTMFGKPVGDALVKIRSNEDLMKRLGTESYTLRDPQSQEGASGRQHYEMFSRGPVAAYMHQMKSKFHDTAVPETMGVTPGTKYTDWMGRKFEDFVAGRAGQRINPYEVTTKFMPHEDQLKLMEDFHGSLTPEERSYRLKVEDLPGDKYIAQTNNYMPKAEGYLKMREMLKQVGGTGAGSALGGVMAHLLHDKMRGERQDDKEKRDWLYWTTMLGGAGLGGYLGNKLVKAGAWRSPDMDVAGAQADINNILSMLRQAPGLSFNQRAQLMSGVGQLDPASVRQLRQMLGFGGGAAVGAIIARFLMGKGLGSTVLGALLGGVIGGAVFGDNGPRTAVGNPGLVGVDFSGRRF